MTSKKNTNDVPDRKNIDVPDGSRSTEEGERPEWERKIEFVLACTGYAVGLGNIWRFPFLCYESGGGAFLIPYVIMLFVCGIPLFYMELAVGQFTRLGPIGAIGSLCPLFKGAGLATVLLSFFLTTYYNVIIGWAIYYIGYSFTWDLPWKDCSFSGHSENCWDNITQNTTTRNNMSVSPSEDFYNQVILKMSSGIETTGSIRGPMFAVLFMAWVLVYFSIWKGVKVTGKIVYFTALFPYVILVAFLIRGVTLPGAYNGVEFFIKPKWSLLMDAKVWTNAAIQNFNSIGIAFGGLIAMASYNPRKNDVLKDTLIVGFINAATSILSGFVIFSILGYIANVQNKKVEDVVTSGPGLVFVTYPAAIATMQGAPIWSLLFFVMIICLGLDSQFCMVEVVVTTLYDTPAIRKFFRRKEFMVLGVCVVSFLLGIPYISEAGIYYFKLIDTYSSGISLMFVAFFEVIAICWFYGAKRLARNIGTMTGRYPYTFFIICWYFISPLMILGLCIFQWVQYKPVKYKDVPYPLWAHAVGWIIAGISLICIPVFAIIAVYNAKGTTIIGKLRTSTRSVYEDEKDRESMDSHKLCNGIRLEAEISEPDFFASSSTELTSLPVTPIPSEENNEQDSA